MTQRQGIWDGELPAVGPSAAIVSLLEEWKARRANRLMPAPRDMGASVLMPWQAWLIVWEVLRDDAGAIADFRYRQVGNGIVRLAGVDHAGHLVSERTYANTPAATLTNLRAVAENGQPRYRDDRLGAATGHIRSGGRLFLPLASDGFRVDEVLCYLSSADQEEITPPG